MRLVRSVSSKEWLGLAAANPGSNEVQEDNSDGSRGAHHSHEPCSGLRLQLLSLAEHCERFLSAEPLLSPDPTLASECET